MQRSLMSTQIMVGLLLVVGVGCEHESLVSKFEEAASIKGGEPQVEIAVSTPASVHQHRLLRGTLYYRGRFHDGSDWSGLECCVRPQRGWTYRPPGPALPPADPPCYRMTGYTGGREACFGPNVPDELIRYSTRLGTSGGSVCTHEAEDRRMVLTMRTDGCLGWVAPHDVPFVFGSVRNLVLFRGDWSDAEVHDANSEDEVSTLPVYGDAPGTICCAHGSSKDPDFAEFSTSNPRYEWGRTECPRQLGDGRWTDPRVESDDRRPWFFDFDEYGCPGFYPREDHYEN